jgi:hypothetical protein
VLAAALLTMRRQGELNVQGGRTLVEERRQRHNRAAQTAADPARWARR